MKIHNWQPNFDEKTRDARKMLWLLAFDPYPFHPMWHIYMNFIWYDTLIPEFRVGHVLDPGPLCRCLCQAATVSPPKETTAPREAEKPLPAAPEPKEVTNPKAIGWSETGSSHIGGLIGWYNGYMGLYGQQFDTWGLSLNQLHRQEAPISVGGRKSMY